MAAVAGLVETGELDGVEEQTDRQLSQLSGTLVELDLLEHKNRNTLRVIH